MKIQTTIGTVSIARFVEPGEPFDPNQEGDLLLRTDSAELAELIKKATSCGSKIEELAAGGNYPHRFRVEGWAVGRFLIALVEDVNYASFRGALAGKAVQAGCGGEEPAGAGGEDHPFQGVFGP